MSYEDGKLYSPTKIVLEDGERNEVRRMDLPQEGVPKIIIDGETNIMYQLGNTNNNYRYTPVLYMILGTKSEALVSKEGNIIQEIKE